MITQYRTIEFMQFTNWCCYAVSEHRFFIAATSPKHALLSSIRPLVTRHFGLPPHTALP
jgi:hypothetical protein